MNLDKDDTPGLLALISSEQALVHAACNGWSKPQGEKLYSAKKKTGASITHDPKAVQKLEWFDAEVDRATNTHGLLSGLSYTGTFFVSYVYADLAHKEEEKRLKRLDGRLGRIAQDVDYWLIDRQIEIMGCNAPDDCDIFVGSKRKACGFLGNNGCKLNRK